MMASIEGLDGDGKEGGGEASAQEDEDELDIVPLARGVVRGGEDYFILSALVERGKCNTPWQVGNAWNSFWIRACVISFARTGS